MRLAGIITALIVVILAIALGPGQASAGGTDDVSGAWDVQYALSCTAEFTQSGSSLSGSVDCGAEITADLEGTIDTVYRTFSMTGMFVTLPITVNGTVSADGSSLEGTWSAPPIVSEGPFSASRLSGAPDPADITGSWSVTVENIFAGSCTAEIDQAGGQIAATIDCPGGPSGSFEGTYDSDSRHFEIVGPFGQFAGLEMEGTVSEDMGSFEGSWFITPDGPGGVLSGQRVGGPPPTDDDDDGDDETPSPSDGDDPTPTTSVTTLPETGTGTDDSTPFLAYGAALAAFALGTGSLLLARRVR